MRPILLGVGLAVLGGCAALPPTVDHAVSEAVQLVHAPSAEQKDALANAEDAFKSGPTPFNRVRLATLLASLPPPLRDDARAAQLLRKVSGAAPNLTRFAELLSLQIAERQRLAKEVDKLSRELDRLAKEHAAAEKERETAEKERDKREESLRQQLEALRAIERGILEREERLRKKPEPKR